MCWVPVLIMKASVIARADLIVHGQRPFRAALGPGKAAVSAAKEYQRVFIRTSGELHHAADENQMVAAVILRIRHAFEMRDRASDQRRSHASQSVLHRRPFVGESAGEI